MPPAAPNLVDTDTMSAFPSVAPSPPSMAAISQLLDVTSMTRLLHETIAAERAMDSELESLLSRRPELERKLLGLHRASETLELVRSDAEHMLSSVASTCQLAEAVSGKVRELDVAQSHVSETLNRIDSILERASCIDGVRSAMDAQDYEAAAKYVATFLQLDADGAPAGALGEEITPGQAAEQRRQLLESKALLESIVIRSFQEASERRDQATVERFIRLYAPLGLGALGSSSYASYLRQVVASRAQESLDAILLQEQESEAQGLRDASLSPDWVDCLTSLLRDVALAVEGSQELLETIHPGGGGGLGAIRELQAEVDIRGSGLVRRFSESRGLARLAKEASSSSSGGGAGEAGPGGQLDPRQVEVYLEEALLLSKRCEDFAKFMAAKTQEALALSSAGQAESSSSSAALLLDPSGSSGAFRQSVQEVSSHCVALELYFMRENIRKAIQLDEPVAGLEPLTSSLVDDAFYILQNSVRRAVGAGSLNPALAVLNHAGALLAGEVREALAGRIRERQLAGTGAGARLLAGVVSGGGAGVVGVAGGTAAGAEVALAVNNCQVAGEYVVKLRQDVEEYCMEIFSAPSDREKIRLRLAELTEISDSFRQMATTALSDVSKSLVPRLRPILDSISSVSYELSEAEYADNEANDPWVQRLLLAVETNVAWLQPLLTPTCYDTLIELVVEFVVRRVEALMWQKPFNQLGGLQLDRDCRALLLRFSAMSGKTVRDRFARLTQMAQVLNMEKVSEILDYWGDNAGPTTWRLSGDEVKRTLELRVDFNSEAIATLRL